MPLIFVGACEVTTKSSESYEFDFSGFGLINLKVSQLRVENRSLQGTANDVAMRLALPPLVALEKWVDQRLKATGSSDNTIISIIVHDSKVIEQSLDQGDSIRSAFINQQSHRYSFVLKVSVEAIDKRGKTLAVSSVKVERSTTTAEGMTLTERNHRLHNMTKKLFLDFDRQMQGNLAKYFLTWLED
uniref:ABC-type transport auxiliary lipoprotein component domain-containing protein n=1 Tax=uncultured nuHF1 cluster bacterium HF0770_35I22 TaxID=723586 RepID=E7C7M6_9BACT|nr:hypothetical protein [uncultured nuHF1 cluster bacterium HF0770_35I22]